MLLRLAHIHTLHSAPVISLLKNQFVIFTELVVVCRAPRLPPLPLAHFQHAHGLRLLNLFEKNGVLFHNVFALRAPLGFTVNIFLRHHYVLRTIDSVHAFTTGYPHPGDILSLEEAFLTAPVKPLKHYRSVSLFCLREAHLFTVAFDFGRCFAPVSIVVGLDRVALRLVELDSEVGRFGGFVVTCVVKAVVKIFPVFLRSFCARVVRLNLGARLNFLPILAELNVDVPENSASGRRLIPFNLARERTFLHVQFGVFEVLFVGIKGPIVCSQLRTLVVDVAFAW